MTLALVNDPPVVVVLDDDNTPTHPPLAQAPAPRQGSPKRQRPDADSIREKKEDDPTVKRPRTDPVLILTTLTMPPVTTMLFYSDDDDKCKGLDAALLIGDGLECSLKQNGRTYAVGTFHFPEPGWKQKEPAYIGLDSRTATLLGDAHAYAVILRWWNPCEYFNVCLGRLDDASPWSIITVKFDVDLYLKQRKQE